MLDHLADAGLAPIESPALAAPPSAAPARARHEPAPGPALLGAVLDEIDYGVMLVDPANGAVLHANRLALDEVELRRTLDVLDGRAEPTHGDARRALAGALAAVRLGRRSLIALRPADGPADGALQVSVVPLAVAGAPLRALLLFGKRQVADGLSVGFFARAHALTPTEGSVLLSLCRGRRPTQIAADHGVAISTVRTHVNSIRLKTGTSSIRELIDRLAALPPMAPALRRCTH